MKRETITMDEYGRIAIPSDMESVWMSAMELSELFGITYPTLRAAIRAVYKSEVLKPHEAERYIKLPEAYGLDVYCLQMIVALAFRINSVHAETVRNVLLERIVHGRQKEKTFVFLLMDMRTSAGTA